jgi:magnesium and cobalt exporter, CNNM family
MSDLLRVLAVLALVGGNAFFVIGEYSVVTARRSRVAAMAEEGRRGTAAALRLMDDPVRVISTVQVGITAVGILTGAVGEPLVRDLLGDGLPTWAGFVIAFAVVTYLSVVLGELVPKALTLDRAERLVVRVARPIEFLERVLRPVVWLLQGSAEWLLRPFGISRVRAGASIQSADELRALVDEAEGAGVIPRAQEEMLHNVFDFASREARDVMVPAPDVAWLDAEMTVGNALARAAQRAHTRYPVARGSIDHLVGVVHVRELVVAANDDPDSTVEAVARPAFVIPETKDLGALLRELRERSEQIAVVTDEYGRTIGIVTLEDIVEEIVGEIQDEYDLPDSTLTHLPDGRIRVAGSMTVDDLNETLGTHLPQDRAHTVAGLVLDLAGRRPESGESVSVDGVVLTVESVDGARIRSVLIQAENA